MVDIPKWWTSQNGGHPKEVWEAVRASADEHQRSFVKEPAWALQAYVKRERRQQAQQQQGKSSS